MSTVVINWILHLAIGFPVALIVANLSEWLIHKYILHGLGKHKKSFWSFHWHAHHRQARRDDNHDPDYDGLQLGWNPRTKEILALGLAAAVQVPLLWWVPGYALGMLYSTYNYYYKHKKSHIDVAWAKEKLPWHYDHHMGDDQDANWCVTRPWFDLIMGTRIAGTHLTRRGAVGPHETATVSGAAEPPRLPTA